jgi:putative glycosyltransferase (TIGR04372 family)
MTPNGRPDAAAFEADMRARFVQRENLARLFALVQPHLDPDGPTLVYVLTQSERIGHFTIEPQILKSLYGDRYRRIVILTGRMDRPGTNPWVRHCFGDQFVFVETDDPVLLAMGFVDGGLADLKRIHLLLQSPRLLIVDFWRRVVGGVRPARLRLPATVAERGAERLRRLDLDPDAPFALFHMRTMKYQPGLAHHGHRTATVDHYAPSVRAVLDAGFQVVRIGEPGIALPPGDWDGYFSLPDAPPPDDRAADLYALAHCDFGFAQNSGPIWVAAAFGRPTLRTNTPFEHLNLPYNDDLSLFKLYRDTASGRILTYREILDRRLPAVLRDADFAERGIELVENDADTLLAATREMLAARSGTWQPDAARHARFRAMGAAYEAGLRDDPGIGRENMDFYGYGHPFGWVTTASFDAVPGFLD